MWKSSGRRERLHTTRLRRRKLKFEPLEPRRLMAAVRGLPGFSSKSLAANDDNSVGPVAMGFTAPINYFGTSTSTVFINNNGNVTFDSVLGQYTPFSLSNTNRKILAPFFADVETFSPNIVRYGNDTVDGRRAFGVEWPGVGYFSSASKRNFFELVIIERFDTGAGNFDVEFNYDQIRWETGDASGGTNGLGGSSARVGFASGTSGPFREFVGSAINGAFLDSNTTTGLIHNRYRSDQNGRYVLTVRGGAVVDPDLQVEAVQVTNLPAISGKTLNIQWNVKNAGNDATPNGWSDRVRVVNRATGAVVANQLIIYDPLAPGNGSIGPGTSRTRSLAVTLPDGNPGVGVFDITVTTDALQQIFEANPTNTSEANNSGTASFSSTLAPYPNLNAVMQGVPTGIDALQQFAVTLDVGNTGNSPTNGSWKDRLYFSSTQTVTANSTLLFDVASLAQLAVGGSYRHTFNVTAPQVAEGSYYIIAVSNADSGIFETDRANNTVISPLSIFRPDLKPRIELSSGSTQIANSTGSLDLGASALDQAIVKTVTIRNSGPTEMTLGTVVVTGGAGFSIVSQPNSTVAPGAQTTFQIRFDAAVMGERSATISIPNNDPTKNPFTFQVSAFAYANVDLVVASIGVDASASVGGTVDLNWDLKNQGTGEFRGTFADRVWMSTDNLVGSDRFLADFSYTGTLLPGQTTTRTQRITLPSDAVGTQYFIVRADALAQVVETDETNNTAVDDRFINIMAPDLQVYDVQVASVIPTGTQTQFNWKVRNAGTAATPTGANWSDRVYLSNDAILDAADLQMATVLNPQALAVNESYASSAEFTIPYGTYGLRYVIIKTDETTQVVELNETNNINAGSSTNIRWQPPDLRVTNVISQFFAFAGAPMRVSWDVRNVGLTPMLASEANWHDRVWLSTDNTLSANDRSIGEFLHSGLLRPGEGYTQSLDVNLPPASVLPAGDYYVIVETDSRKEVKEGPFEGNNVTSETSITQIVHTPPPDLIVDVVDTPPSPLFSGQTLNTVFRVKNAGAGNTEPRNTQWSDRVYLSTDNVLDSNDRLISTRPRVGGLAASASYDVSTGIVIPSDVIGVFHVIVVANAFAQVFGDDLTNNTTASISKITIQKPPADLDVTSVSSALYVVEGRELTVAYTVRNVGPQATAIASWKDRVFLSTDTVLGPEDRLLAETSHAGAVEAGAEYRRTVTGTVNQVGSFYVIVKTDAADEVFEINRANNIQAAVRAVNVVPTPADLTTSQVSAPPMVRSGMGVPVSFRVTNTGPSTTLGANWLDRVYISNDQLLDVQDTLLTTVAHTGALQAAPDFYDAATQLVIPENFNGDYFLIVKADDTDVIFEDDDVDNSSITSITVVSQPADLIVDSINVAASAESGGSLRVDWTVKNQGTGDTLVSSWRERIYISNDNVFSPGTDQQLSEFVYTHINGLVSGPLDAGRTVSRSDLVTLPNTTGQRYLFVVVDATNVVFEPDREDNNASSPLLITINPRNVDLRVTSVTAPAIVEEGIQFDVTWTVKNVGTARTLASHWYDDVYLSSDNQLSADDVRLGSLRRTNGLVANAQYSVTSSFAIPQGVVQGSSAPFYLLVKTDGGDAGQVAETVEDNNVSAADQPTLVAKGTVPLLPNLQVSSVQAPTSGQVGQPITVDWTVQNVGPGVIASGQWIDAVYLSLDKVLDRQGNNRDIYLGFRAQSRAMASGVTYSDTATFTLPVGLAGDYYVLVATDSGAKVAEGPTNELDNVGSSTAVLTVEPKPPADLVVGTITIPANGVSSQNATITYTVTNAGSDPAIGSWYDSLFISSDDVWDVDDRLFNRVLHRGDLLPSASYTESVTAVLPGLLPGDYHIIVRSDIRNQIAEGNETNNIKASLDAIDMDVQVLVSGVSIISDLLLGQSAYFRITVPVDRTLFLSIDSTAQTGDTQLFVAKDRLPSRSEFDLTAGELGRADQLLMVPDTEAATYYVLAFRSSLPSSTPSVAVRADLVGFSLRSVDQSRIGNGGKVTLALRGAQLRDTQSVALADSLPSGRRQAERFVVVDSSTIYATFDLSGLASGKYSIVATNSLAETAELISSIEVEPVRGGEAQLSLTMPENVRPGQIFQAVLNVYNDGNVDAAAPLVQFNSNSTLLLGYDASDLQDERLTVLVVPPGGFRDTLRPGQTVQVVVTAQEKVGNNNTATLNVRSIGGTDEEVNLLPLLNDDQYAAEFGPNANIIRGVLDGYTSGPANDIVKSLLTFAANNLDKDLGYMDAALARQTQLAMVSYLSSTVDLSTQSVGGGSAKPPLGSDGDSQQSRTPGSNATFTNYGQPTDIRTGKLRYIIPGFLAGDPPQAWVTELAEVLKQKCPEDTIVIVGWSSGKAVELGLLAVGSGLGLGAGGAVTATGLYYAVAASRTPDLGERIAKDIIRLGKSPSDVVIYGHSLGAQAAGFAGAYIRAHTGASIGQIVGFDPAGPYFDTPIPDSHLEQSDATFVQVINTSPILGRFSCDGHENYYPDTRENGAWISNPLADHSYSHEYYYKRLTDPATPGKNPDLGNPDACVPGERKVGDFDFADEEIDRHIRVRTSLDPNDIIGPVGFGPERWVAATQPLDYMIRFENDPVFATAPAQQIRITQTLDSDLDFRTFRLGDFGMGDLLIDVPENRAFYSTRLDLRATKGIYVDVLAGINVTTGEAFWNFTAVDPVTGDLPSDPLKGLLPPNINPPEGDGFVRYSIRAKSTVVTGTRIDAMARIIFDTNEPIDTPPIFNTLDAVAPTSQVDPLSPELVSFVGRFPVSWTGSDDAGGSALRGFDIYVRVDDGPYRRWLTDVSYTTAFYDGPVGNSYAFYSVAHDNAGLAEPVPALLDTDIRVIAPQDVAVETDNVAIPHATGTIDFGSTIVASAPLSKTLTVRNTGKQPLTLSSASLTLNSGFSLLTNLADGTDVQPGQTMTLVVALNADQVGSKSATLQFGTNVPGKSPFTLILKGQVREVPALFVALESNSIAETGAFIIGMVSRNTSTDTPLVVSLASSREDQGTVPASVTIPAGATRVTFRFTPKNDPIADGTQSVSIVATALGLTSASAIAQVTDDEIAILQMSLAVASIREDEAPATGTVTRNTPTNVDLVVNLSSSDTTAATVPPTVTIPAGSTSATFTVTAVNDALFDGDQVVEIAARSAGLVSDTAQVTIVDEDEARLLIDLSVSSISEIGGSTTGAVTRNTPTTSDLVVQLSSSDITAATVPASVTIRAGQRSASFDVTIVNDARFRGNVNIQISAQANGLPLATAALEIVEDDPRRPWHNAPKPLDVNADGVVSPIDALLIINFLNQGMSILPDPVPGQLAPPPYVDVTQDGFVTPLDALLVINQLNAQAAAEGEQVLRPSVDWSAFDDFAWLDSHVDSVGKPHPTMSHAKARFALLKHAKLL